MVAKASGNQELGWQLGHLLNRLARFMVIVHSGKYMIDIHGRSIERLKAHDPVGVKKALHKELAEARIAIMDKIMKEEVSGIWEQKTELRSLSLKPPFFSKHHSPPGLSVMKRASVLDTATMTRLSYRVNVNGENLKR